jgi:hypothetical protein
MRGVRNIVALLVIGVCRGKPNTADPEPASPTKPTPTEQFGNVWQLDSHGNYWLFWKELINRKRFLVLDY